MQLADGPGELLEQPAVASRGTGHTQTESVSPAHLQLPLQQDATQEMFFLCPGWFLAKLVYK